MKKKMNVKENQSISHQYSKVDVYVTPTNEEAMIIVIL